MTRRRKNNVLTDDLVGRLAEGLAPLAPAPDRVAAIKGRLLERVRGARSGFVTVRTGEGDWVEIAPLVHWKVLHDDGCSRSFLLRMAPGARLPQHGHTTDETCVVLEGSVQLGDIEVRAGDFHLALTGSVHGEISTRTGALLFIRGASEAGARV